MKSNEVQNPQTDYKKHLPNIDTNSLRIPNINNRIILLDIQTTGLNSDENFIIEIGCYEMIQGKITGIEFHTFLHPTYGNSEANKQKGNQNHNSSQIDSCFADDYASDHICLQNFKIFVNNCVIVAHNAQKAVDFLNKEFLFHKIDIIPKENFYCTLEVFKKMFPEYNENSLPPSDIKLNNNKKNNNQESDDIFSLKKCCEYLDVKLPRKNHYTAKYESFMETKLFAKILELINEVKKIQLYKSKNKAYKINSNKKTIVEKNKYINNHPYANNIDMEEIKNDNIMQLIEEDYKNSINYNNHYNSANSIVSITSEFNKNININNIKKNFIEQTIKNDNNSEIKNKINALKKKRKLEYEIFALCNPKK